MVNIIILYGKAGSGKDTIMQEFLRHCGPDIKEIISCTTRPKREGEVNGKNYYFITVEDFESAIDEGEMIEYTKFNNWYYGIGKETINSNWMIGVLNPEGIWQLKIRSDVNVIGVFIDCPDKIRLLRQLNREKNPDVSEIIRRYKADEEDFPEVTINKYMDIYLRNDGVREPVEMARELWLKLRPYRAAAEWEEQND